jgi:hypothetical protein
VTDRALTDSWIEVASEIIEASESRWTVEDYKRFCGLQLPEAGKDRFFRLNVLAEMLQQNLVVLEDGRLALGDPNNSTWLCNELRRGDTAAWSFVEASYPAKTARKFDDQHLKEIGLEGEKWVVEQYREKLSAEFLDRIRHVSVTDDTLGFDIASPSIQYKSRYLHIEVKTSVRATSKFEFYLSRNEYEVSRKDQNWVLLLVRKQAGLYEIFGHAYHSTLHGLVPIDVDDSGSWASAKLSLASADVFRGLP